MEKKNIIFVGEHPWNPCGNGHMMEAILRQLDGERYNPAVFARGFDDKYPGDPLFEREKYNIVTADSHGGWGEQQLVDYVTHLESLSALVFVGIDIWIYRKALPALRTLCDKKNIPWIGIIPYDLQYVRKDWVNWINMLDYPCVYSKYGEKLLKKHVPGIRYFRPPHYWGDKLYPYDVKEKREARKTFFPSESKDTFIFGYVGVNQLRKSPHLIVKAFCEARNKADKNLSLYLHTDLRGEFNLVQMLEDYDFAEGAVRHSYQGVPFSDKQMRSIYNAIDCLILCSMQEGLSWVPLEAMLCGTPVIVSDTTAHPELVSDAGLLVACDQEAFLPVQTISGISWVDAKQCRTEDIVDAMIKMAQDEGFYAHCSDQTIQRAKEWLNGVSNINNLLDEALSRPIDISSEDKIKAVLFVQHSSAGDVLMTTQCFKGIKERHPDMPLVYMTQKKFQDIVTGNPHIDEIIDYDIKEAQKYSVIYNPHGEKILPGGWNSLDVKLADMYPYFCKVKADEMCILEKKPSLVYTETSAKGILPLDEVNYEHKWIETKGKRLCVNTEPYIIVHTTGGQPEYRTYNYMNTALKGMDLPIVQIGGGFDYVVEGAIDLRGKLTWRETAWLMKRAKVAVCVDSFPMHLAGALGTPLVALFGPAPARVTGSIGDPDKIINLEPNKLDVCSTLQNCWGQPGEKCSNPCINTINPLTVKKAIKSLLAKSLEGE